MGGLYDEHQVFCGLCAGVQGYCVVSAGVERMGRYGIYADLMSLRHRGLDIIEKISFTAFNATRFSTARESTLRLALHHPRPCHGRIFSTGEMQAGIPIQLNFNFRGRFIFDWH